jgi:hypothetical protein
MNHALIRLGYHSDVTSGRDIDTEGTHHIGFVRWLWLLRLDNCRLLFSAELQNEPGDDHSSGNKSSDGGSDSSGNPTGTPYEKKKEKIE